MRTASPAVGSNSAALLFACLFPTLAAWLYFVVLPEGGATRLAYAAGKLLQFGFPLAFLVRTGRFPGPPTTVRPRPAAGVASGVVIGLLIVAAYLGARGGPLALEAAAGVAARLDALGMATPLRFLLVAAFLSILHSLLEEYYWRGFVHGLLRERLGRGAATLVSSVAFASHHVIVLHVFLGPEKFLPWTLLLSAGVVAAGACWAWIHDNSGSLRPPWISHLLVDVAVMAVGYDLLWPLG